MHRLPFFVTALLLAALAVPALAQPGGIAVPDEPRAKILAAIPADGFVKPASPRKLLIFHRTAGFYHDVIPIGTLALQLLGEKTGAYATVATDDPEVFTPESLRQFDAVCFMSTTGDVFTPDGFDKLDGPDRAKAAELRDRRRQAFVDYLEAGGGFVGSHAATDTCYGWPPYGELVGGYFDNHPWNEEVTIKLDEPDHPLNAAFGGKSFKIADEIYQMREPYSRRRCRVLLSLDTEHTNMKKDGVHRTDGDFAVSWVRTQGKGRIFYCSLGHRHDIFWNTPVLQHYLAGIQFAFGDLKAAASPTIGD